MSTNTHIHTHRPLVFSYVYINIYLYISVALRGGKRTLGNASSHDVTHTHLQIILKRRISCPLLSYPVWASQNVDAIFLYSKTGQTGNATTWNQKKRMI